MRPELHEAPIAPPHRVQLAVIAREADVHDMGAVPLVHPKGRVIVHAWVVEEPDLRRVPYGDHVLLGVGAAHHVDIVVPLPVHPDSHHWEAERARPRCPLRVPLVDGELLEGHGVPVEDFPPVAVGLDHRLTPQLRRAHERQRPVQMSDGRRVAAEAAQMAVPSVLGKPVPVPPLAEHRREPARLALLVSEARVVDVDDKVVAAGGQELIVGGVLHLIDGRHAWLKLLQGLQGLGVHDAHPPHHAAHREVPPALGEGTRAGLEAGARRPVHVTVLGVPNENPVALARRGQDAGVGGVGGEAVQVRRVPVDEHGGRAVDLPDVAAVGARDHLRPVGAHIHRPELRRGLVGVGRGELEGLVLELAHADRALTEYEGGVALLVLGDHLLGRLEIRVLRARRGVLHPWLLVHSLLHVPRVDHTIRAPRHQPLLISDLKAADASVCEVAVRQRHLRAELMSLDDAHEHLIDPDADVASGEPCEEHRRGDLVAPRSAPRHHALIHLSDDLVGGLIAKILDDFSRVRELGSSLVEDLSGLVVEDRIPEARHAIFDVHCGEDVLHLGGAEGAARGLVFVQPHLPIGALALECGLVIGVFDRHQAPKGEVLDPVRHELVIAPGVAHHAVHLRRRALPCARGRDETVGAVASLPAGGVLVGGGGEVVLVGQRATLCGRLELHSLASGGCGPEGLDLVHGALFVFPCVGAVVVHLPHSLIVDLEHPILSVSRHSRSVVVEGGNGGLPVGCVLGRARRVVPHNRKLPEVPLGLESGDLLGRAVSPGRGLALVLRIPSVAQEHPLPDIHRVRVVAAHGDQLLPRPRERHGDDPAGVDGVVNPLHLQAPVGCRHPLPAVHRDGGRVAGVPDADVGNLLGTHGLALASGDDVALLGVLAHGEDVVIVTEEEPL
mmetsp:Transcript_16917/g.53679  ORF Transcript_16917/g.53679 Transcript_16917/m.53679 type:complete len:898 (-) Transcript_16917:585-3278(-)